VRLQRLLLVGLLLLSLAGVALLFADTSALPAEDFKDGCGDWWCAPHNRFPVGLGILFGGLGLTAIGLGLSRAAGDPEPRRREGRRRRGYH
jgi:hypothetical protein